MDMEKKLDQWIRAVFNHENFKEIHLNLTGASEKGDGYIGDITFAKVNVVTSEGETKDLDVVIKHGKLNDSLRESTPVRAAFEREIYMYGKIIPELRKFENGKKLKILDQFFVKCYGTLLYDKEEVVVLENLKAQNYDMHDRYQPMNINYLKLTFEMYGKWHAMSFAYQDQNPEKANILFENLDDILVTFMKTMNNLFAATQEGIYTILQQTNEVRLIERLKKQIPNFEETFYELLSKTENEKSVLIHGDCWNNNFMYKCNSDKSKPVAVKFLDLQVVHLRPPVFDLAYHLYSVASEKELQQFDELLKVYHTSLSKTLKDLGSDADSVYSYEDLLRQWKKFSAFGVIMAAIGMQIFLSTNEDTLELQDFQEDAQLKNILEKALSANGDIVTSRTIAFTTHYLDSLEKL